MFQPPHNSNQKRDRLIGRRLGKYRIIAKLGEGGMGTVYDAEDESLKRNVALKLVSGGDPNDVQRFVVEAQAAARLNHPHVVTVYEVDEVDGQYFLAMELVRGMSAADYVRTRGRMKWTLATRVLIAACRGLAAAHKTGLIHRDLKPGNILLAKTGEIKLADFGLAKCVGNSQHSITAQGTVLGTPEYMSPEQCSSDRVTAQSDLYSLGACYFALLTGKPPFVCDLPVQTMFAHCSQAIPDPREHVSEIPAACAEIIRCAMAKQSHDRFADAAAMQAALEAVLRQDLNREQTMAFAPASKTERDPQNAEPVTLPHTGLRNAQRRGLVIGFVLALSVVVLGIAAVKWQDNGSDSESPSTESRPNPTRPGATSETKKPRSQSSTERGDVGNGLIGQATRAGHPLRLINGNERAYVSAAFAPNGRYLAVRVLGRHEGRLIIWDVRQPEPILDRRAMEYSNRGEWLQIEDLTGSRLLTFTRNSDWLIAGALNGLNVDVEAWPVPPRAGNLPLTLRCGRPARSLLASPTQDELAVSLTVPNATNDDSLLIYSDWPRSAARTLLSQRTHRTSCNHLSFDPAGEGVWISNGPNNAILFSAPRPGQRIRVETDLTISAMASGSSGDQTWLAFGGPNIVEIRDSGSRKLITKVTLNEKRSMLVTALDFSADGRTLFVACHREEQSDLLAINTRSWTLRETLGTSLPPISSLAVSPTDPLLVTATIDGTLRLWKLDGN